MLDESVISEIKNSKNTGIEHEIALFYLLLQNEEEKKRVGRAIQTRDDSNKIQAIIARTSTALILSELKKCSLTIVDAQFTTQNDDVGPADIVLIVQNSSRQRQELGLSVKNKNTCTLNATGRKFLSESQILKLKKRLPEFTQKYLSEMRAVYGNVTNWFRKRRESKTTDEYIDLIRDEVLLNWKLKTIDEKRSLLREAYHETSPIPFWVLTFTDKKYEIDTTPFRISSEDVCHVEIKKHETSFVAFYLKNQMIGKMQVKFNNGFLEENKSRKPSIVVEGVQMKYGAPFFSWNFSVVKKRGNNA